MPIPCAKTLFTCAPQIYFYMVLPQRKEVVTLVDGTVPIWTLDNWASSCLSDADVVAGPAFIAMSFTCSLPARPMPKVPSCAGGQIDVATLLLSWEICDHSLQRISAGRWHSWANGLRENQPNRTNYLMKALSYCALEDVMQGIYGSSHGCHSGSKNCSYSPLLASCYCNNLLNCQIYCVNPGFILNIYVYIASLVTRLETEMVLAFAKCAPELH